MNTHDMINDQAAAALLTWVDLARIPGETIAAAMKGLPPAAPGEPPRSVATVAPYGVGPVRLHFKVHVPQASQRRRGIAPFWVCERATKGAE